MKVGMFFNEPVAFAGHEYSAMHTRHIYAFGKLAEVFDEVQFLLPVKYRSDGNWPLELRLQWEKVKIVGLPYFVGDDVRTRNGIVKLPIAFPIALPRIIKVVTECDVIGAAVPSIFGNLTSVIALSLGKPVFHYLRGDKKATLSAIYPEGLTQKVFKFGSVLLESYVRHTLRRGVPTFVVGDGLLKKYSADVPNGGLLRMIAPVLTEEFIPTPDRWKRVLNREETCLLYVGRLSPEKGVHVLLDALALLFHRHGIRYEVRVVGDGPEKRRLEELTKSLSLPGITFLGFIPHGSTLVKLYQDADILVVPSLAEGLGAVILEAMACGLPVIGSNVGGIPTIVKEGVNGLLVAPNDPVELAEAILHLSASSELRNRLSSEAVKTAEEFRIDCQMRKLVEAVVDHYGLPLKIGEDKSNQAPSNSSTLD